MPIGFKCGPCKFVWLFVRKGTRGTWSTPASHATQPPWQALEAWVLPILMLQSSTNAFTFRIHLDRQLEQQVAEVLAGPLNMHACM